MKFTYIGRTEHGRDATFTPYPDGHTDPLTWDKGEYKGAGKWWLEKAVCNKCGLEVAGHPDSGMGAYAGFDSFSKAKENHHCPKTKI